MNQLRKFGAWLWLNKERMILGVLVLFLCYRVYVIMGEVDFDEGEGPDINPPRAGGFVDRPQTPPPIPRVPPGGAVASLANKNLLSYVAGLETNSEDEIVTGLTLISIGESNGEPNARIRSRGGRRTRSKKEGDKVGGWIIERIREEEDSVDVRHEATGQIARLVLK